MVVYYTEKELRKLDIDVLIKIVKKDVNIYNKRLYTNREKNPAKVAGISNLSARIQTQEKESKNLLTKRIMNIQRRLKTDVPTKKEVTEQNVADTKALLAKLNYLNNGSADYGDAKLSNAQANRIMHDVEQIERTSSNQIFYHLLNEYSDNLQYISDFNELEKFIHEVATGTLKNEPDDITKEDINKILNKYEI